jgi:hypothetical protein
MALRCDFATQEAQLREREQSLNIRESMLEKTQRRLFMPQHQQHNSQSHSDTAVRLAVTV